MGFLGDLIPGLGAVSSLVGLFSSGNAANQAQQAQQAALQQATNQLNAQYENALTNNQNSVYQASGLGGDAINAMGRNLGDSLAHAGVYNSTGVAGALSNAQTARNSQIADLAQNLQQQAWQMRQSGLMNITGEGLGVAGQNLNYARQQYGNAAQGLVGYLGSLGRLLSSPGQSTGSTAGATGYSPTLGVGVDPAFQPGAGTSAGLGSSPGGFNFGLGGSGLGGAFQTLDPSGLGRGVMATAGSMGQNYIGGFGAGAGGYNPYRGMGSSMGGYMPGMRGG